MNEITLVKQSRNPMKRGGASFFNIDKNKFILIGGGNRSEEFDDVWELTIQDNELEAKWEKVKLETNKYSKRTGQSGCLHQNQVYLFGGQNYHINKHFEDFLSLDLSEDKKSIMEQQIGLFGPKDLVNTPTERNSSAMACNVDDKIIYLVGGADSQEPLSDIFQFSLDTKQWKRVKPEGDEIKAVEMHTLNFYKSNKDITKINAARNKKKKKAKKNKNQKLVDINFSGLKVEEEIQQEQQQGGNNEDSNENIAKTIKKVNLEFDPNNVKDNDDEEENFNQEAKNQINNFEKQEQLIQQAEKEEEEETKQEEDQQQEQEEDQNKEFKYLILAGGRYQDQIQDSLYAYDIDQNKWIKLKDLPSPLCAHASVILPDRNEMWIFGGTDGAQFLDTLYIYNFHNGKYYKADLQEELKLSGQKIYFGPRMACSMAYDQDAQKVIVFGGSGYEDENSQIIQFDVSKINSNQRVKKI